MSNFLKCFRKEGIASTDSKGSIQINTNDEVDVLSSDVKNSKNEYVWYPPISQGKLIDAVRYTIPHLSVDLRKGYLGRIGIIGGSKEYAGAPYFAGISSLKIGADLCHIFCTPEAAIPIKCYSPELIVHPLLPSSNGSNSEETCNKSIDSIRIWLGKMDVIVIGCGLGRDKEIIFVVTELIKICRCLSIPIIIDADGLFIISQQPDLISGYKNCILTPNIIEFFRLEKSVEMKDASSYNTESNSKSFKTEQFSRHTSIAPQATSYTHIEVENRINKIELNADSLINIPTILPLGVNEERYPESISPCERIPNIEWPSVNNETELRFQDDGEEINLFSEGRTFVDSDINNRLKNNSKSISNPLNICFYEHILNDNCIGINRTEGKTDFNNATQSQSNISEEEFFCIANKVFKLCKNLGNICIALKDKIDIISNGQVVAICNITGSYKRSGGQGDILSGVISPLFHWAIQYFTKMVEITQLCKYPDIVSAYGACLLVRLSAYIAFKKKFRSMTASDLLENLSYVFESIFEVNKNIYSEKSNVLLFFNDPQSPNKNTK